LVPLVHSCPGGTCLLGTHGLDNSTSSTPLARPPCSPHSRPAARPRTRSQGSGDKAGVTRTLSFLCVASTDTDSTTRSSLRGTSTQLRVPPSSLSFATPCPRAPPPFRACSTSLRQSGADTPPSLVNVTGCFSYIRAWRMRCQTFSRHLFTAKPSSSFCSFGVFWRETLADLAPQHCLRGSSWRETSPLLHPSRGECRHTVHAGCGWLFDGVAL